MNFNDVLIGSEMPGSALATLANPDDNYFQLTTPFEMAGEGAA